MYIFLPVASGVNVTYRIICDTAIPIEALPIPRVRHECIRLQEPPQRGIVWPRAVVVEAQAGLLMLTSCYTAEAWKGLGLTDLRLS